MRCLTMSVGTQTQKENTSAAKQLAVLKNEREAAWAAFNPKAPASRTNDWVAFALANAAWRKAYTTLNGQEPAEDGIERDATAWYARNRSKHKDES